MLFEVVQEAVGEAEPETDEPEKNPHAVALGRLGGKKGGKARAAKLSKKRRSEIESCAWFSQRARAAFLATN